MPVLKYKPLRADDFYTQGIEFVSRTQFRRALAAFNEALVLDKRHERALYARAILYGQLDDDDAAIADFTHLLTLSPQNPLVFYMRGLSYRVSGGFFSAIADFTRVIELEPQHYDAYLQRAEMYALMGFDGAGNDCLERAINDYNTVLGLNPSELSAYKNRGLVRAVQGDMNGAISDCQRYLDGGGGHQNGDHDDVERLIGNLQQRLQP